VEPVQHTFTRMKDESKHMLNLPEILLFFPFLMVHALFLHTKAKKKLKKKG
jgi:hypothetical protein